MNFSERYLALPVRIYDGLQIKQLKEQEDERDCDWVKGWTMVGYEEMRERLYWTDGYSSGRETEEVARDGFDITVVYVGDRVVNCVWDRKKFERELDEFMSKMESEEMKNWVDANKCT